MPAVESRRRNSTLGSIALFTGLPALALAWFDFGGLPKVPVGPFELKFVEAISAAALLLAVLSLLLASASKRTGTEIPLVAILVCGAALGMAHFRHGFTAAPAQRPGTQPPAAPVQTVTARQNAATTIPPNKPSANPPPATSTAATNAARAAAQAAQTAQAFRRQQAQAALRDARANYNAARDAIIKSLENDPLYQAVKSRADQADRDLQEARATLPPGNSTLAKNSENALEARDKLTQFVDDAMLNHPDSLAAVQRLQAATEAAKQ
jgi:hypothetical protein